MSASQPLPVKTAIPNDSIWQNLDQAAFRKRIDDLKEKNDVPGDPKVHTYKQWQSQRRASNESNRLMTFDIEARLADDLAFVAAARKDVKAVSAVALEESKGSHGLVVRLAANGAVQAPVIDTFSSIFVLLQDCARKSREPWGWDIQVAVCSYVLGLSREICRDRIFDLVVDLNRDRLHSRLQSKHAQLDGRRVQRKPLSQDVPGLARHAPSTKNSEALKHILAALSESYRHVDACAKNTEEEKRLLKRAVQQSYDFCTPNGRTIQQTISFYGFKGLQILKDKYVRQVNKIGRYWGLCGDMTEASRKYSRLFDSIYLRPLPRYKGYNAPVATKPGAIPCFVHAEIQLLTFYGLQSDPNAMKPRVLGVSKSACYLCNLFILHHGQFFITKTHGRLYPLWNLPDLAEYNQAYRLEVRRVLAAIDREIQANLRRTPIRRPWPTESFVHLPARFLTSPVISDLATLPSEAASNASRPASPGAVVPRAASLLSPEQLQSPLNRPGERNAHDSVQVASIASTPRSHPASALTINHGLDEETLSLHDPRSAIANESNDQNGATVSSSSVASWEYPVQRTITTDSPFQTRSKNFYMTFEIDGSALGNVSITDLEDTEFPRPGIAVDIRAMRDGETMHFDKRDEEDDIMLNLRHSNARSTQVALQWLPRTE